VVDVQAGLVLRSLRHHLGRAHPGAGGEVSIATAYDDLHERST
jgi:hypothetical protein